MIFKCLKFLLIAGMLSLPMQGAFAHEPGGSSIHVIQYSGTNIRVSLPQESTATGNQLLVVDKLATYWVTPPYGSGRIRITVPVRYYLTSWDVQALERELERLGIKVKPKPKPVRLTG